MDNENKVDTVETTQENVNKEVVENDTVAIPKSDYDKLNQTLGSLKRELKDLKKPKAETTENTTTKSDENRVLEKLEKFALRSAGVTHQDDIKLAQDTAKKWGVDIDEVLADDDFKVKLERQQTGRANVEATSNVRGSGGTSQAKNTSEYWIAKGNPPTPSDVPDRKIRAKITRDMMANAKTSGKKFYNS